MEKSKNLKKRRLMEAFNEELLVQSDKKTKIDIGTSTTNENFTTDSNDKFILPPRILHIFDMKIKRLEQWEMAKRCTLERLALEIEELREKEEEIERKAELLEKFNKETAEKMKNVFQQSNGNNRNGMTSSSRQLIKQEIIMMSETENSDSEKMIVIGPNGTVIPEKIFMLINWEMPTAATRKLLMTIFDRDTLAFHTLTGKPSPAFMGCDRPLKNRLDPLKVNDIIHAVMTRSNSAERDVRSAITTKCADENKMFRQREKRRKTFGTTGIDASDKENTFVGLQTTQI